LSGSKIEAMEEFDVSTSKEGGSGLSAKLDQAKRWLFLHSQHLNFFTILTLASVSTSEYIYIERERCANVLYKAQNTSYFTFISHVLKFKWMIQTVKYDFHIKFILKSP
jgi:hypothetical protein